MNRWALAGLALLTTTGCALDDKQAEYSSGSSWAKLAASVQAAQSITEPSVATSFTRYVDSAGGSDTAGDGRSATTAYRTIGRALSDIPAQINGHWIIRLAGGNYAEGVNLRKFVMPAGINNVQLKSEEIVRAISIVGNTDSPGVAAVQPPSGVPCFSASDIVIFLDSLSCTVSAGEGVSVTGSSLIVDDVLINAESRAGNGIYAEDSRLYFGGGLSIVGPFAIGMSLRVNTFARAGTRKHPQDIALSIDGAREIGIFLRDGGNFTGAFEGGSVSIANSGQGIYAILASRVFIPAGITLDLSNVGIAVNTTQQSFINAHRVNVRGSPAPFARCHKDSYILLEQVSASPGRTVDTDRTCSTLVY